MVFYSDWCNVIHEEGQTASAGSLIPPKLFQHNAEFSLCSIEVMVKPRQL